VKLVTTTRIQRNHHFWPETNSRGVCNTTGFVRNSRLRWTNGAREAENYDPKVDMGQYVINYTDPSNM